MAFSVLPSKRGLRMPTDTPSTLQSQALGPRQEALQLRDARTLYLIRFGTQEMLAALEVKGEATDASSSESEMPPWALFRAWGGEEA